MCTSVQIVQIIHIGAIIAMVSAVFVKSIWFKQIILAVLILLMFQYLSGYGRCGLTELEYAILGEKEHKNGFIYRIINPMITVNETYINYGIYVIHVLLIAILFYQLSCSNNNKLLV